MEWQETVLQLQDIAQLESMEIQLKQIMTILQMPQEKQLDLQLCLLEVIHNGLVHGNQQRQDKQVLVQWRYRNGEFVFAVTDEGTGFIPAVETIWPEDILAEDGRGLMLLNLLLDNVWYNEQGNSVHGRLTWCTESDGECKA